MIFYFSSVCACVSLCVCVYHGMHAQVRGDVSGMSFLLPPLGAGTGLGHRAWRQVPLSEDPSCYPASNSVTDQDEIGVVVCTYDHSS